MFWYKNEVNPNIVRRKQKKLRLLSEVRRMTGDAFHLT